MSHKIVKKKHHIFRHHGLAIKQIKSMQISKSWLYLASLPDFGTKNDRQWVKKFKKACMNASMNVVLFVLLPYIEKLLPTYKTKCLLYAKKTT